MFLALIIFFVSLIIEVLLFIFTSPETTNGNTNHFTLVILAVNSGVVLGSLYSLVLMFVYSLLKAYDDLHNKLFVIRGILFGSLVSLILLGKFYDFIDMFIIMFLVVIFIALDVIFSRKEEQ